MHGEVDGSERDTAPAEAAFDALRGVVAVGQRRAQLDERLLVVERGRDLAQTTELRGQTFLFVFRSQPA
jgi:hypothetical protein